MGYIRHNAMIVAGRKEELELAHIKAVELFGELTTNVIKGIVNGYQTFFVAPDGSKEGCEESDVYDEKRKQLADYIDSLAYGDGSNSVNFVDLGYDEYFEVNIDRKNT